MELSPEQNQAAELIAQGHKYVAIAERLNISRKTIHLWMRIQPFRDLVKKNETEILEEHRRSFFDLVRPALDAYKGILDSWEEMPASATRVATTVLKNAGLVKDEADESAQDGEVTVKWAELKPNAND